MDNRHRPRCWELRPFDDSAVERVLRMGLISAEGKPDRDALAVLSCVFAGQYFDDLCDYCQDLRDVRTGLSQFFEDTEQAAIKEQFLQICLQYDAICQPLPAPVWWISSNIDLIELFSLGFIEHLRQLAEKELKEEST